MATSDFNPNRLKFQACTERLQRAVKAAGLKTDGKIITSKDDGASEMRKTLSTKNVPKGFHKWQLPVHLDNPSHLFITVAEPNVKSPRHSHKDGDGIRFVAGGSITYEGKELGAGDWMFIPAGKEYSFQVGPLGAVMCYCYAC
jgi:hypothetical protein